MNVETQTEVLEPYHFYDENDVEKLSQETSHLTNNINFFPELVWNQIIGKLSEPNDIESCSNSSLYFGKLLHKKRQSSVVFPKALHKLFPYLFETKSGLNDLLNGLPRLAIVPEENENVNEDNEAGDNLNPQENQVQNIANLENHGIQDLQEISLHHLWNCRLVSKSWNSVIEAMFRDKETGHYTIKYDMTCHRNLELDDWANDRFAVFQPPQFFTEHFDLTHYDFERNTPKKNPFLGRSAQFMHFHIINTMPDEYQDYIEGILDILIKYGSELWYVFFDVHNGLIGQDPLFFYDLLRNFINLMPNLKVLRIMYTEDIQEDGGYIDANVLRMMGLHQLEQAVQQNPLVTLPHLEFLGTVNLPTPVFNELLQKNRHISMLQADRKDFHGYYNIFGERFPNLKTLNLQFCSVEDFERLESYQFTLGLERIYFWYDNSAPFISWSRVFNVLTSKLGKSCTELLLQMPVPKNEAERKQILEDSHVCRLDLPKLEKLQVFDDSSFCLDFFLPAKNSLKFIVVRYSNDDNVDAVVQHLENQDLAGCRQLIEFVGFKEKLQDSNIWKEFPNLGDVTLHRNRAMGGCITYLCDQCGRDDEIEVEKRKWYRENGEEF